LLVPQLNTIEDLDQSVNINEAFDTSVSVGKHAFSRMENDVDQFKKNRVSKQQQIIFTEEKKKRFVKCYSMLIVIIFFV
jgi:hypothetical protein